MKEFLKNTTTKIKVTSKGVYKKAKAKVDRVTDVVGTKVHYATEMAGHTKRNLQVKKNAYVDFNIINAKLFFHFNVLSKFK